MKNAEPSSARRPTSLGDKIQSYQRPSPLHPSLSALMITNNVNESWLQIGFSYPVSSLTIWSLQPHYEFLQNQVRMLKGANKPLTRSSPKGKHISFLLLDQILCPWLPPVSTSVIQSEPRVPWQVAWLSSASTSPWPWRADLSYLEQDPICLFSSPLSWQPRIMYAKLFWGCIFASASCG